MQAYEDASTWWNLRLTLIEVYDVIEESNPTVINFFSLYPKMKDEMNTERSKTTTAEPDFYHHYNMEFGISLLWKYAREYTDEADNLLKEGVK